MAKVREGDMAAYGELWRRHRVVAIAVARRSTSNFDPDDLVAEAYAVILSALRRGGGPVGDGFRAYLCTTVRNLARRWGTRRQEFAVDEVPEAAGGDEILDGQLDSLDERLVRAAFASLPARWQEVLWYTEIDGLGTAETAEMLGITPNAAAVLAFRAREGLRKAWLQEHVADATREGECGWVLAHIGEHSRDGLRARAASRIDRHLAGCRSCRDVALEVGQVSRRLARILLPLAVGGGSALAWLGAPAAPVAAATGIGAAAMAAAAAAIAILVGVGGVQVEVGSAPLAALPEVPREPVAVVWQPSAGPETTSPTGPVLVLTDRTDVAVGADELERRLVSAGQRVVERVLGAVDEIAGAVAGGVELVVEVAAPQGAPAASTELVVGDLALGLGLELGDDGLLGLDLDVGLPDLPDFLP